ncbi:accessory gene regulator B family protein [Clostridium beijerinckii]|uniref:accessory gene regulator B family protein n=1 Tax=Clostridium beijerinckii TaxID=1520 RepID=UPI00156F5BB2|nr:accessory gene regulator B family protein [Clostridium beijerinckii]NRT73320.1 accessory gene regulator B [Clostridium beijerinckii]
MIKLISTFITRYLEENNSSLIKTDLLKIQYTLEVILGNLFDFVVILLIFLGLNKVPILLLSYVILISIRPFMGGVHCKTFISCLFVTTMYFIMVMLFTTLAPKLNNSFNIIFFTISFIIVAAYAPCRNLKRPVKNKATLKIISLISLASWIVIFFSISNIQICNCILASIFFQILQVIIINMKGVVSNAKIYKYFFIHTS